MSDILQSQEIRESRNDLNIQNTIKQPKRRFNGLIFHASQKVVAGLARAQDVIRPKSGASLAVLAIATVSLPIKTVANAQTAHKAIAFAAPNYQKNINVSAAR